MKRPRSLLILHVLALSCLIMPFATAQSAGADSAERRQADAFLARARAELASGRTGAARELVTSALELAPAYSESLYLRALLEMGDRTLVGSGITDLRAALVFGTWATTAPAAAEQALGELLLRTGQRAEARTLLERLSRSRPEDPRTLLLLARVYDEAGDRTAADRALAEGAARFPLVDDFRLLSASRLERQGKRAAALAAIATGLKLHPDGLPLLLGSARLETPARRPAAVDAYLQKGGVDPLAAVLGMESSAKDRRKYLGLFLGTGGLARQDLVDRAVAAVRDSKDLTSTLRDALSGFSGTRDLDRNGDGFWEDRWVFDKGTATAWFREPSQDGQAQYAAAFRGGEPVTFRYAAGPSTLVTLHYSRYPFIDSAVASPGSTSSLVPYSTQCVFLQQAPAGGWQGISPRIASSIRLPTPGELRSLTYKVEERGDNGSVTRTTMYAKGQRIYGEEDLDGDGSIDHRLWYANGVPDRGERALVDDGVFQVNETWKGGRLAATAVDTDGDGRVDYRETYGANAERSWDFNEDGRDDSREYTTVAGDLVREMATLLDGKFDLRIVFRAGRIAGITRAGVPVTVTVDPARGVTWIGEPASSRARPDATSGTAIQSLAGKDYLVFLHAGILYAEILP